MKKKIKIQFSPKENKLESFLETIKSFGNIYYNKYSLRECPKDIQEERKFTISGKNNNIITKIGKDNNYYGGTICEDELDESIEEHKWKIKILKSKEKYIMIGVSTIDFNFNAANFNTCGWYLFCINSPPTLYSGPPFKYNNFKSNLSNIKDEIVVVMNMKKRTLKFIINNEDKGDSYTDIPIDKPLFPAIILYHQNDSVEITEC